MAFSTSSNILATVESSNSFVVLTRRIPFPLIQPLITSAPTPTLLGTDSPVKAEVSRKDSPSTTIPSSGIFSPGFMTIILSTSTSSGSTSSISPSTSKFAYSGHISIRAVIDSRDLPTA